jgi:hypothetical protein
MAYNGPYHTNAYLRSNAARKIRLIGFESNYGPAGYQLKADHRLELKKLTDFVAQTTSFFFWIVGYASKAGNHNANKTLSANRALSVLNFLKDQNANFGDPDRLDEFIMRGDEGYIAGDGDNSADERAVEVHIFLGDVKPPPPPHADPQPRRLPPLPGGPRFAKWQVAAAFGLQIPIPGLSVGIAGLQVTGNLFSFKKLDGGEAARNFISLGVGAGVGLPALGAMKNFPNLWNAITAPSWSGFSYSDPVIAKTPFNFDDLSGADVAMAQAGAGIKPPTIITPIGDWFIPTGYQFARLSVSNKMWHYDSGNQPFFSNRDMLTNVDVGGPQSALGASAGVQGGALIAL